MKITLVLLMKEKSPHRMCVITRNIAPKHVLLRITRSSKDGILFDKHQTADGRSMYISPQMKTVETLFSPKKKGLWKHALKCDVSEENRIKILKQITNSLSQGVE